MALGYIFQAEILDRTGKEGAVQEELEFIAARMALVPNLPELMTSLRKCMEEQARLVKPIGDILTKGTPPTPDIAARIKDQKMAMMVILVVPFVAEHNRDNFASYIMRWLQTIGM